MERSADLEEFIGAWFAAATTGDSSLASAHVSTGDGTRLIGSDPTEDLRGGEAVRDFLIGEVEGAGGQATFHPTDIEAFCEGTVGWATTNLTITMSDGRRVSPRWTAVLHREDGAWKFIQTHASIGVPNADIGWEYPD
jgi:ketosteroid isomerase-like protein